MYRTASVWLAFSLSAVCLLLTALFARALFLGVVFAVGAVYFAAVGIKALREDPYDLRLLREIEERKEKMKKTEGNEGQSVFCPFCAEVYDSRLKVCPNCGRSVNA